MYQLYEKEFQTLPFTDYGTIINTVKAVGAKSALEFGPGYSTLALIESGLPRIVSCECHDGYRASMTDFFKPWPVVTIVSYTDTEPVTVDNDEHFDLAFVDSPRGKETDSRLNTLLYAIEHAPVALLHDISRTGEQMSLDKVRALGHKVELLPNANMAMVVRYDAA